MADYSLNVAKALFIGFGDDIYPDNLICSGTIPAELNGRPCEYSNHGRIPDAQPLNENSENYSVDKGNHGDLCPPCALQQLSNLEHWNSYKGKKYPDELLPLRLFKCRKGFWLVVLGLHDSNPITIKT